MPNRLEMVVRGQRQTALPNTPDFTSRTWPTDGFFMEGTRLSSMELPDHWIPFYGVGLQFIQGTGKRFFIQLKWEFAQDVSYPLYSRSHNYRFAISKDG